MKKIWFSFFDSSYYKDQECFYNANEFAWLEKIENNWEVILSESLEYLSKGNNTTPYFNKNLTNKESSWKSFAFMVWGVQKRSPKKECPLTVELFKEIQGLVSASISILGPNSVIKPHIGDTDGIKRCHLGLVVPEKLPECGIMVGKEQRSWEEGKLLVFNDAQEHSAWNKSEQRRVVMILDVVKEDYLGKKKYICAVVLSRLYLQGILGKIPVLRKLNRKILIFLVWVIYPFARLRLLFS